MSGPIVRTGATPEYWENWDQIFGKKTKKKSAPKKKTAKAADKPAKAVKKKAPKKKAAAAKNKSKK